MCFFTQILNSGSPNDFTNYKLISILHPLGLCFEKILLNHIYPKIRKNLSNTQHGFRKKRSTLTQFLSFLDGVYRTSDFKVPSPIVYFDVSKAFESVRHDIILNKLSIYGCDHDFLLLFFCRISVTDLSVFVETRTFPIFILLLVALLKAASWGRFFSSFYQLSVTVYIIFQLLFVR